MNNIQRVLCRLYKIKKFRRLMFLAFNKCKIHFSEEDHIQLNGGALIQLLNLIYEENFDEDTPNKFPTNIIRFGLIR